MGSAVLAGLAAAVERGARNREMTLFEGQNIDNVSLTLYIIRALIKRIDTGKRGDAAGLSGRRTECQKEEVQ